MLFVFPEVREGTYPLVFQRTKKMGKTSKVKEPEEKVVDGDAEEAEKVSLQLQLAEVV